MRCLGRINKCQKKCWADVDKACGIFNSPAIHPPRGELKLDHF